MIGRARGRAQAEAITDAGGVMTHRQILLVIFGLMAGMFLSALDQTIVGTSMRTVADDLDGLNLQASVTTAYLIVSTVTTPIYGRLSDLFGRRPLFIIAITIFLIGSLLSGLANSMFELAAFRAVQGLGAGGLMALPLAIMGDILAPRERAKYQGYFLAVFATSSVVGPLIGGLFAGTDAILGITGWRWVFLVNLPIGVIALAIVLRFLHIPHTRHSVRIDWWGAVAVILAVVPGLLVAEQGREWGWASPAALACYAVSVVGLAAFILVERAMGDDALLPLRLFRHPTFSMAIVLGALVGFGMFGAMMTVPLYLQLVNGATPTESGLLMLPMILGLMSSSIVSGQVIARTGRYRIFPIVGTGLLTLGFFYLSWVSADKPVWFLMGGMLLIGLGLGQLLQTLTLASQSSVGPREIGVATSSATFFRQIGGTLGVAVLFSVLFGRVGGTITSAFRSPEIQEGLRAAAADPAVAAEPANARILAALQDRDLGTLSSALDGDSSFLAALDPRIAEPFRVGFSDATVTAYWVSLGVVLLAFVLSFFLQTTPLREKSALQENTEAAIAAQHAADRTGALVAPDVAVTAEPSASRTR